MNDFLPCRELLEQQAVWFAPARSRLLRRAHIAGRRRVLDLACGPGTVTGELVRRCGGSVIALDRNRATLGEDGPAFADAWRVGGDAGRLPFADRTFDLVFCQFALMWFDLPAAVREIRRVLQSGGALIALEPDYGGMIEYPVEIASREIWSAALNRAGADPQVGRKLPGLLSDAGFQVRVDLLDRLEGPSAARFDLLRELPLTDKEKETLDRIETADAAFADTTRVAHLPIFLVTAELG